MSDNNYGYTEIYHLKNQSVTVGPLMPFGPLHAAYAYPFGETFVVAGGSKPKEGGAESTGTTCFFQKAITISKNPTTYVNLNSRYPIL